MELYNGNTSMLRSYLTKLVKAIVELVNEPHKPSSPDTITTMVKAPTSPAGVTKAINDGNVVLQNTLPDHCISSCGIVTPALIPTVPCENGHNVINLDGTTTIGDPLEYITDITIVTDNSIIDGKYLEDVLAQHILNVTAIDTFVVDRVEFTGSPSGKVRIPIISAGVYNMVIGGGGGSGSAVVCKHYGSMILDISGGSTKQSAHKSLQLYPGYIVHIEVGTGGEAVTVTYDNTDTNPTTYYSSAGNDGNDTVLWVTDTNGDEVMLSRITSLGGLGGLDELGFADLLYDECTWYSRERLLAFAKTALYPVGYMYNMLYAYASTNSLLSSGVQPNVQINTGDLNITGVSNSNGAGGGAVINGFEWDDPRIFTATSGAGGVGFYRLWRAGCSE